MATKKLSDLTPQEAAKFLLARKAARESFLGFCKYMQPEDQQPQAHHILIANALDKVSLGTSNRVMLTLPPGSAKSTFGSGLFPAYFLGKHPGASIIAGSHTTAFAERWGRRVRNMVGEKTYQQVFDLQVAGDSAAAGQWSTSGGGEYFAVGAGARVQGRRADCLLGGTAVSVVGGHKAIEHVVVGDRVITPLGIRHVLALSTSVAGSWLELRFECGRVVNATPNHRFKVSTERPGDIVIVSNWVAAKDMRVGNWCLTECVDGSSSRLTRVTVHTGQALVYDIQVEGAQCFFANGILVHNCMIIDDPFGSREDADSELIRTRLWDWYKFDLSPRLKPGGRVVLINTRYHMDDLAGKLLETEPEKWEVINLPMEAEDENDPLGRKVGERLWPEWFTQEMVDDAKRDPRTWSSLYQQRPVPLGGGELKKSWVQYYDHAHFTNMPKIMLVDPAGGRKDKKSDYTAIWVIGLGEDENLYVLDMVRDRINMAERTEIIFRLHRKWKPAQTRVERYGLMADVENLKNEMNRRNYRFPLLEVGGATKKEDRIRRLVPYFMGGRVWFPRELMYTDYSGKSKDLVRAFVEEELAVFPVGAFDDMLDALARIAEPTLDLPWPSKNDWAQLPVLDFGCLDPEVGY